MIEVNTLHSSKAESGIFVTAVKYLNSSKLLIIVPWKDGMDSARSASG